MKTKSSHSPVASLADGFTTSVLNIASSAIVSSASGSDMFPTVSLNSTVIVLVPRSGVTVAGLSFTGPVQDSNGCTVKIPFSATLNISHPEPASVQLMSITTARLASVVAAAPLSMVTDPVGFTVSTSNKSACEKAVCAFPARSFAPVTPTSGLSSTLLSKTSQVDDNNVEDKPDVGICNYWICSARCYHAFTVNNCESKCANTYISLCYWVWAWYHGYNNRGNTISWGN